MKKTVLALAALATLGFAGVADAKLDRAEREAYYQTIRNETAAPAAAPVVVEGRNATVAAPSTAGVEPYIVRSIEQDARGNK